MWSFSQINSCTAAMQSMLLSASLTQMSSLPAITWFVVSIYVLQCGSWPFWLSLAIWLCFSKDSNMRGRPRPLCLFSTSHSLIWWWVCTCSLLLGLMCTTGMTTSPMQTDGSRVSRAKWQDSCRCCPVRCQPFWLCWLPWTGSTTWCLDACLMALGFVPEFPYTTR